MRNIIEGVSIQGGTLILDGSITFMDCLLKDVTIQTYYPSNEVNIVHCVLQDCKMISSPRETEDNRYNAKEWI